MMRRNGLRLLQLINQLLDLSRMDAGKMTVQVRPLDLVSSGTATGDVVPLTCGAKEDPAYRSTPKKMRSSVTPTATSSRRF